MNLDAWRRANELFEQMVDLAPAERQALLDRACGDGTRGDLDLRQAVEQRLRTDAEAERMGFLAQPIVSTPPGMPADGAARQSTPPESLGPYRILHAIGQGGMGTVYAAERDDDAFHRRVAIKVITAGTENREIVRRMQTERRILALLEHPNIARIYDAGASEDGLPYFVMEHVDGEPIDTYCSRQGCSIEERVVLLHKVCAAVDYANRNLVVHRDLKPSNILVTADGEPKLLDFGIAKLLADGGQVADAAAQSRQTTVPWHQRLSLNYASPEQIRGQAISTASDVYALGVLLFQLLTGGLPRILDGLSPWQAEQRLTSSEPPRPSTAVGEGEAEMAAMPGNPRQVSSRLRGDLDSIVLKALRTDAQARYPSAALLAEDLDNYLHGFPVGAHRGSWRYRSGKFLRRYRLAALLATSALLFAGAFVVTLMVSSHNLARGQERLLLEQSKLEQILALFLTVFEGAGPYISEGVDLTVRQAVDRHVDSFDEGLEGQPAVQAAVLSTLGWVYLDLGELDKALGFHQRALTLRRNLEDNSSEVAESLDGIAATLREQAKLDRSDALSAEAIEIYRSLPDVAPHHLLRSLNNRVTLHCWRNEWQAADPLSQEALSLSRTAVEESHPEVSKALIQRAQVLNNLGEATAARQLFLEAEASYARRFGPNHPVMAVLYNELGRLELQEDRPEAAVDYWRQADAQYAAAFGEDFYDRVIPLTNLGSTLARLGRTPAAEAALRDALHVAVSSPALGPEHEIRYFGQPAIALGKLLTATDRCPEVISLLGSKLDAWRTQGSTSSIVPKATALVEACRDRV